MNIAAIDMEPLLEIARRAGKVIMEIYGESDLGVSYKDDDSPLTRADTAAHQVIDAGLKKLWPDIPVISEESKIPDYETRKEWPLFWLVDPLDGTKEFINRNGEFTVNIALIENNQPVLGIVYAPALELMYYSQKGQGAWRIATKSGKERIPVEHELTGRPQGGVRVVASRSHRNQETNDFIGKLEKHYSPVNIVSKGSSLKICLIAEGSAEIYPRLGPTMEWDVAAGHAIVREALGDDAVHGLSYNKQDMKNEYFIVKAPDVITS